LGLPAGPVMTGALDEFGGVAPIGKMNEKLGAFFNLDEPEKFGPLIFPATNYDGMSISDNKRGKMMMMGANLGDYNECYYDGGLPVYTLTQVLNFFQNYYKTWAEALDPGGSAAEVMDRFGLAARAAVSVQFTMKTMFALRDKFAEADEKEQTAIAQELEKLKLDQAKYVSQMVNWEVGASAESSKKKALAKEAQAGAMDISSAKAMSKQLMREVTDRATDSYFVTHNGQTTKMTSTYKQEKYPDNFPIEQLRGTEVSAKDRTKAWMLINLVAEFKTFNVGPDNDLVYYVLPKLVRRVDKPKQINPFEDFSLTKVLEKVPVVPVEPAGLRKKVKPRPLASV